MLIFAYSGNFPCLHKTNYYVILFCFLRLQLDIKESNIIDFRQQHLIDSIHNWCFPIRDLFIPHPND